MAKIAIAPAAAPQIRRRPDGFPGTVGTPCLGVTIGMREVETFLLRVEVGAGGLPDGNADGGQQERQ